MSKWMYFGGCALGALAMGCSVVHISVTAGTVLYALGALAWLMAYRERS